VRHSLSISYRGQGRAKCFGVPRSLHKSQESTEKANGQKKSTVLRKNTVKKVMTVSKKSHWKAHGPAIKK